MRKVPGVTPAVFELGNRAQRSVDQQPRRRAGVLFRDGRIEPGEGPPNAKKRHIVNDEPLVAEVKAESVDGALKLIAARPIPRLKITLPGTIIVHKNELPIIVQCPRVPAHRSEIREPPEGELQRRAR